MNTHELSNRSFFAFEKELWKEVRNADLHINPFKPLDHPVLKRGGGMSPDNHRAISPSVIYDGEKFTMWYTGLHINKNSSFKDHRTVKHFMCTATSKDGITWRKPNLKRNVPNIANPKNALFYGVLLAGVDYLPEVSKYAMALSFSNGRRKEGGQTTFSLITSKNGHDWEINRTPAISHQHFETCTGPKKLNGCYWVIGQGISPHFHLPDGSKCGRSAFGFYSKDLKTWKLYPFPLFYYPPENEFLKDHQHLGFQNHLGFTAWNRGRINLGMVGHFWPGGFAQNVRFTNGLIYSHDCLNWREPFPKTPVLYAGGNSWFQSVIQGNSFYQTDTETWFWFSGSDHQGNTWEANSNIGLAKIRRDGFAYYSGRDDTESVLITHPMELNPEDRVVYINAETPADCPMTVELLDMYMEPIIRKKYKFSGNNIFTKICELPENCKNIRLHISFRGLSSRLYSFDLRP